MRVKLKTILRKSFCKLLLVETVLKHKASFVDSPIKKQLSPLCAARALLRGDDNSLRLQQSIKSKGED